MATNYKQKGDVVTVAWATTSPTAGDPVVKTSGKATGGLVGVALNGIASASESINVATCGVFDVSIAATAVMTIGDYVYALSTGGIEVCTTTLSTVYSTGLTFGQLLEPITTATTMTKKVRIMQPKHL